MGGGSDSGDMAILFSIILILGAVGLVVPLIDTALTSSYNVTANYNGIYGAAYGTVNCTEVYMNEFTNKYATSLGASVLTFTNYGNNVSTNNTGFMSSFLNDMSGVWNFISAGWTSTIHSIFSPTYTFPNATNITNNTFSFKGLTDSQADMLGLQRCSEINSGWVKWNNIFGIIGQMFSMIIWSCQGLPMWLNIIVFMPLRLIALIIIFKDFIIAVIP